MADLSDYSPEELQNGLIIIPNTALSEILSQFQERMDDGYISDDQLEYYQQILAIFAALIKASEGGSCYIFNYPPMEFTESTEEAIQETLWGDDPTEDSDS